MFVIVGIALGALIAVWSWQLAGGGGAVIATALYALDPNFAANVPLFKNDVILALLITAMAYALWRFGRKATWLSLAAIALCCAAAINVKFSGLLCGMIIFVVLLLRAMMPRSWDIAAMTLTTLWRRLLVVAGVCVIVMCVSFAAIWACYRFRFMPSPDPNFSFDIDSMVQRASYVRVAVRLNDTRNITPQMVSSESPGTMVHLIVWALSHRVLPQAWLYGLLFTRVTTYARNCFLLGRSAFVGWWYYFPCAMAFKTPMATLAAIPIAIGCFFFKRKRADWWLIICIGVPPILYAITAMAANLNLGLRHILPVYPFLFIALSLGLSRLIKRWLGTAAVGVIVIFLAVESLSAYPNYLTFFNAPSDRHNGINLLSDSNLDWGQDLPSLAKWREQHKDGRMYLAYFGMADPHYYHIDEIDVPVLAGGWQFAETTQLPRPPCYFAISATVLQGIVDLDPRVKKYYEHLLKDVSPIFVVNKTIYIYRIG
jgi:hypothetical protein